MTKQDIIDAIHRNAFSHTDLSQHERLYQYTDNDGFRGILQSKTLWATEYQYLNDRNEFRLIERMIPDALRSFDLDRDFALITAGALVQEIQHQNQSRRLNESYYITSFSVSDDNLLLWSEFSAEAGCAICFLREDICCTADDTVDVMPGKVIYDPEGQLAILRKCFQIVLDDHIDAEQYLRHFQKGTDWSEFRSYLEKTALVMRYYAMFMKESIYSGEQEFRIAFAIADKDAVEIRYRSKNGFYKEIPYIAVHVGGKDAKSFLPQSIRINPWLHGDASRMRFQRTLEEFHYEIPIYESVASLRY